MEFPCIHTYHMCVGLSVGNSKMSLSQDVLIRVSAILNDCIPPVVIKKSYVLISKVEKYMC